MIRIDTYHPVGKRQAEADAPRRPGSHLPSLAPAHRDAMTTMTAIATTMIAKSANTIIAFMSLSFSLLKKVMCRDEKGSKWRGG
jgi:hypothetical protein